MNQKLVVAVVAALMTAEATAEEVDVTFTGYISAPAAQGTEADPEHRAGS